MLAEIGVEADLILFHPYDDGRWNFDRMPQDVNLRYLRYVAARVSSFRNVWWSLANEYDFFRHWQPEVWDELTREIVKHDPYSHLCSIHSHTANTISIGNRSTPMPACRTRHRWRASAVLPR